MNHKLRDYISVLTRENLIAEVNIDEDILSTEIECLSYDTRSMKGRTLFICKGAGFKPEYLLTAIRGGAVAYIADKKYDVDFPVIVVTNVRKAISVLAKFHFNHACDKLTTVGITGTKGKSTTAYFMRYILNEYFAAEGRKSCAIISSIDTYDGVQNFESHLTTPEAIELFEHFDNAVKSGITHLVMEVSSQALKYGRTDGICFDIACFTNIGSDHISIIEHSDFEDYFSSKLKIFDSCKKACVNLDSDYADRVLSYIPKGVPTVTYGKKPEADVYGYNIRFERGEIAFDVRCSEFCDEFRITIPGLFNVENALAAIAMSVSLDIPKEYIYRGLMKARAGGRMEKYTSNDDKVVVIVDYAHNKLSFEKLFSSVSKEYPDKKIIAVFGCAGGKAQNRRKELGKIASRYGHHIIITEEDSGEEPFASISSEIASYIAEGVGFEIIEDRGEAIRRAILSYGKNSVVVITGKGEETRQKRGKEYIECPSDVEYSKRYLDEYNRQIDIKRLLPKLKKYKDKKVLIKLGGAAIEKPELFESIINGIAIYKNAGAKVVVVHGGGKEITSMLKSLNIATRFEQGYRVTDKDSVSVVEMVLSGKINKHVVDAICKKGYEAVGISGRDARTIVAEKKLVFGHDIGYVGEIKEINTRLIETLLEGGFIPVISPVSYACDDENSFYNVNADDVAYAVAKALRCDKLVFMTDIDGILIDSHNPKTLIHRIDETKARELIACGFIDGGMLPKIEGALKAIDSGTREVAILDGRVKDNLILEAVMPKTYGTVICKKPKVQRKVKKLEAV